MADKGLEFFGPSSGISNKAAIKNGSWRRSYSNGMPTQSITYIVPSGLVDAFLDDVFGYWKISEANLQSGAVQYKGDAYPYLSGAGPAAAWKAEKGSGCERTANDWAETGSQHQGNYIPRWIHSSLVNYHYLAAGATQRSFSQPESQNPTNTSRWFGYFFPVTYTVQPLAGQLSVPVMYQNDILDTTTEQYDVEQPIEPLPGDAGGAHPSIAYTCASDSMESNLENTALVEVTVQYQPKKSSLVAGSSKLLGRDALMAVSGGGVQAKPYGGQSLIGTNIGRALWNKIIVERGFFAGYTERASTSVMQIEGNEIQFQHQVQRNTEQLLSESNASVVSGASANHKPESIIGKDALAGVLVNNVEIEVTIENMPYVDSNWLESHAGKVNSRPFLGYPPDSVLYLSSKVKTSYDANGRETFAVTHSFSVKYVTACFNELWGGWNEYGGALQIPTDDNSSVDDVECPYYMRINYAADFYEGKIGVWNRRWCTDPEFVSNNYPDSCEKLRFIRIVNQNGDPPYERVDFRGGGLQGLLYANLDTNPVVGQPHNPSGPNYPSGWPTN